ILVDGTVPGAEAFSVEYNADTTVEYHSPVTGAATFNYSNMADTDQLLAERLTYAATKGKRPSNCATVALKHAASQLGKTVSEAVLAKLVRADGQTTLYDLKQAAQGLGLYCRAVQTDIKTLANLPGCVAILHLPGKNHFVVLDHVDEQYAWLVDLSSNRFYYRLSLDTLPIDWPQGTALLLSSRSIQGPFRDIGNSALSSIVGAVDGWACTKVLQEAAYSECIPLPGDCTGYLRVYPLLYGCEPASNASCTEYPHDRLYLLPCYWDPERGACRADEMYVYLAKACDPD
ncbi:MAG: hypothetical protein JW741_01225, partial [Sedimentisphaerales bacterium]|nr:hypothetical protein [Sedimentisphaerales bacterium]